MKFQFFIILLTAVSTNSFAANFTCEKVTLDGSKPFAYRNYIQISGSDIQLTNEAGDRMFFDNLHDGLAYSDTASFMKTNRDGALVFALTDWNKDPTKLTKEDIALHTNIMLDCRMR